MDRRETVVKKIRRVKKKKSKESQIQSYMRKTEENGKLLKL